MISVVLPAFKARFLRQSLDSILNQTYKDFELIVVNDASPDNISAVMDAYSDSRIRYYVNDVNIGGRNLVEQWNHCISFAKGEWIVLASDDDIYHTTFLETCVKLSRKYPEVDLVHSRVRQINEDGNVTGWEDGRLPEHVGKFEFFDGWMNAAVFVCIGNYMFRTEVLKKDGFVDLPCAFGSDSATAIRMSENGVANTSDMLFDFRQSTIHLSSSVNLKTLRQKLIANTMQFKFFMNLGWEQPTDERERRFYPMLSTKRLKAKCKYDYYNLVIKHLPWSKLTWIGDCELLDTGDKIEMLLRSFYDRLIKRRFPAGT